MQLVGSALQQPECHPGWSDVGTCALMNVAVRDKVHANTGLRVAGIASGVVTQRQFEHTFYTTAKPDSLQQLHKTLRTGGGGAITIQEETWGGDA